MGRRRASSADDRHQAEGGVPPTLTRATLSKALSEDLECSERVARRFLDCVLAYVQEGVSIRGSLSIHRWGQFKAVQRRSGATVIFKPSAAFKRSLQN